MKVVHVFDSSKNIVLEVYFIDGVTGKRLDYTIQDFLLGVRQ